MYKDINSFYMQWHITKKCNCHCLHCYQNKEYFSEDMDLKQLVRIFLQYKDFIKYFFENHIQGIKVKPLISITGGEPFLYKDFMKFLQILSTNRDYFFFCILTNGTLLTKDTALKLKDFGIAQVQISIEGPEKVHDTIRGKGNFKKALKGIEYLLNADIRTHISFTAHKMNWAYFPDVAEIGKKLGVQFVWTDRVIPINKEDENIISLSPAETKEYVKMINSLRKNCMENNEYTSIGNLRALQKMGTKVEDYPYFCHAGLDMFTLMENGDVLACRRMPIVVGNILNTTFKDIYNNNPVMKDLRKKIYKPAKGCEDCKLAGKCSGGLKCLSYAVYGDYNIADPGCWIANRNS